MKLVRIFSKATLALKDLINNSKDVLGRKHFNDRVITIKSIKGAAGVNTLTVKAKSTGDKKKTYDLSLIFYDVKSSDKKNRNFPIRLKMGGVVKYFQKPKLSKHPVRVFCTCKYMQYACFTGDTLIPLLDGKSVPIKDLVGKKKFYVYSHNIKENKVEIGKAKNCKLIKKKAKILKVTLDNGNSVRCTEDHKFLLKNGKYKKAKSLKEGDSLKALYRKRSVRPKQSMTGYDIIKHSNSDSPNNHKVVSVKSDGYEDVYCFEVPEFKNFAIDVDKGSECSSAVFVHNCEWYLNDVDGLQPRRKPRPYTRKTDWYPSPNPNQIPILCLTGDTLISTDKGLERLDSIKVGDKVDTLEGYKEVTAFNYSGKKKVYKIILSSGNILKGSSKHPILTFNTDKILFEYKKIKDLNTGDVVLTKFNKDYDSIDYSNEENHIFRLLGYLISDGHHNLFTSYDQEIKDRFKKSFVKSGFSEDSITDNSMGKYIYKNVLQKLLKYGGYGKDSYKHRIPVMIFTASRSSVKAFLQGLYEGDGWGSNTGNNSTYGTVSNGLALDLHRLLLRFNVYSRLTVNYSGVNNSKMYLVRTSSYEDTKNLYNLLGNKCLKTKEVYKPKTSFPGISIRNKLPISFLTIANKIIEDNSYSDLPPGIYKIRDLLRSVNAPDSEHMVSKTVKLLGNHVQTLTSNLSNRPFKACTVESFNLKCRELIKTHIKKTIITEPPKNKNTMLKSSLRNSFAEDFKIGVGKTINDVFGLLLREDIVFDVVERIPKLRKKKKMYDISVEDAEHFVANGVIVHNCKHLYQLALKLKKDGYLIYK